MLVITATELKENLGKYLKIAEKERINVTRNGKLVTRMVPPGEAVPYKKIESVKDLFGILPKDGMTLDEARAERLQRKCGY